MVSELNDKSNSSSQISVSQSLMYGVKTHLAKVLPSLMIAGKAYTPAEAEAVLQARIDALLAVKAAKAAWLDAVNHYNSQKSLTKSFVGGLYQVVKGMFSSEVGILSDFGIVPRKRALPTAAVRATAVEKNVATRKARGTVGPKAKLKIHGVIPVTVSEGSGSTTSSSSVSVAPSK